MKIINNPNPAEVKTFTCEKCGCEFEWTMGDVVDNRQSNGVCGPGFAVYGFYGVKCPNCGCGISMNILVPPQPKHYDLPEAKIIACDETGEMSLQDPQDALGKQPWVMP